MDEGGQQGEDDNSKARVGAVHEKLLVNEMAMTSIVIAFVCRDKRTSAFAYIYDQNVRTDDRYANQACEEGVGDLKAELPAHQIPNRPNDTSRARMSSACATPKAGFKPRVVMANTCPDSNAPSP